MGGASEPQMMQVALLFGAFILWLLLPLVPALLIHRLLPDNAIKVDGPLQGLKVNASGGIASYLLLVLMAGAFMQSRLLPPINRLDDGGWQFEIPFVVQDAAGNPMLFASGARLSVDVEENPNPVYRRGGTVGYEATLRATRMGGKLPTVSLVGHLPSGLKAESEPIDLERLVLQSNSDDRVVRAPLKPLRVTEELPPAPAAPTPASAPPSAAPPS